MLFQTISRNCGVAHSNAIFRTPDQVCYEKLGGAYPGPQHCHYTFSESVD
jgi:hypothetical protein